MKTYGFGLYGMWGPISDPGERSFSLKVRSLGVDIQGSPYRDYEVNKIVSIIKTLPLDCKVIIWGSSLGANNAPVVAAYVPHRIIDGIWGFQASSYGAQVPITPNVLFAHEVFNSTWMETQGLGCYKWTKAKNNHKTNLYLSDRHDMHPGETEAAQQMFLQEMQRVIKGRS